MLSYRILDNLSMKACRRVSHQTFKRPRVSNTRKSKTRHRDYSRSGSVKFNSLSATLDKLYVWEKKLFREVKVFYHLYFNISELYNTFYS